MEKLPLSVVVVAGNEEAQIERCLRSVPFADELLVIDGESTDQTAARAAGCGAKVIRQKWLGYGPQKRFGVEQARHDWILSLDADEAVSPELAQEIQSKFQQLRPKVGYRLPRRSFHLGRWILHGGWFPDRQLRLFHRRHGNWAGEIHEKVQTPLEEDFSSPLLHWVFDDLSDQVRTNDRYSGLQAAELARRGEKFSLFKLLLRPYGKFLETYFWKRGFLDGLPGLLIAISAAYSMFLKYAKLWEIQRKKS